MDEAAGVFVDLKTGQRQPLSDAIEAGLVTAEYENGQESNGNGRTDTQTYAVNSVVDQVPLTPATITIPYLSIRLLKPQVSVTEAVSVTGCRCTESRPELETVNK